MNQEKRENEDDYSVFIGSKTTKEYVFSVLTQAKNNDKIKIKARGVEISKATDVANISLDRFLEDWQISDVLIATELRPHRSTGEQLGNRPKENQRVSIIEIEISKK